MSGPAQGDGTVPEGGQPARPGVLHIGADVFVESVHVLSDLVAAAGVGARDAVPAGVTSAASHVVTSFQQLLDQMPSLTRELDVLVAEVHARRLSVQALQAELGALDDQLEVFEATLAPFVAWTNQWRRLRASLTERARDAQHTTLTDPIAGRRTL